MNNLSYKDVVYTASTSFLNYVIKAGSNAIYYGHAVKSPKQSVLEVNVSNIIRNYLNSEIGDFRSFPGAYTVFTADKAYREFQLYSITTAYDPDNYTTYTIETLLETYKVLFGYDYGDTWDGEYKKLTTPINGHMDPRMRGFFSQYSSALTTAEIEVGYKDFVFVFSGSTEFDYSGETRTYTVTDCTNAEVWDIYSDSEWITVQRISSSSFIISVDTNSSPTRTGSFYITYPDINLNPARIYFNIEQNALEWTFSLNESGATVDYENGSTNFGFTTNGPLEWLQLESTSDWLAAEFINNATIAVSYSENSGTSLREASIVVKASNPTTQVLGTIRIKQNYDDYNQYKSKYLTLEIQSGGTISYPDSGLSYSINDGTWIKFNNSQVNVSAGDKVRIKGSIQDMVYAGKQHYLYNSSSVRYRMYGNVLSMRYGDNFSGGTSGISLRNMFSGVGVTNAEYLILPSATTNFSYSGLFYNCKSLKTAPRYIIIAGGEQACQGMFSGCTSLEKAPQLIHSKHFSDYCFRYMFQGCTALTTAPEITFADGIYPNNYYYNGSYLDGIFSGCTSLNYIKTTLPYGGTGWLDGVSPTGTFVKSQGVEWEVGADNGIPSGWIVTSAEPILYYNQYFTTEILTDGYICFANQNTSKPGVTLQYSKNYGAWNSINSNQPELIAVSSGDILRWKGTDAEFNSASETILSGNCEFNIYGNIMSLINGDGFIASASTIAYVEFFANFYGIFSGSKVVSAENLVIPGILTEACCYGMFYNCTLLEKAPKLPADTYNTVEYESVVAEQVYAYMFQGCTSLATAPELPAQYLSTNAYYGMFSGCTSLNYVKCMAEVFGTNALQNWLSGVSSTGTFVKRLNTTWPSGASGIPNGWTIVQEA